MKQSIILLVTALIYTVTSCDRPTCVNENLIFEKYSPEDERYKRELAKQLKSVDKSDLQYWSYDYREDAGLRFLYANVQNGNICAIIVLNIEESEKGIEHLIEKKNMSYQGAELKGLQFEIKDENGKTEFIFQEVSRIID